MKLSLGPLHLLVPLAVVGATTLPACGSSRSGYEEPRLPGNGTAVKDALLTRNTLG